MRAIGLATVGLFSALTLVLVYVGLRSIPDIQRYLRINRM
jgi:hypothetical protein